MDMRVAMLDALAKAELGRAARIAGAAIKHMTGGRDVVHIGDRRMGEGDAAPDDGGSKAGD